jgi:DNA-binding LacI/PurR family transcriptional regulator
MAILPERRCISILWTHRGETFHGKIENVFMPRRAKSVGPTTIATVKHVAERAGVSTATVSRVLSGLSGVREPLRTKVVEAARQLGYQPNRAARDLRARSSRTIGVLIPDIENPFFTTVVRGIEETLQATGYTLLLANYNEEPAREATQLRTFRAEGIGGLIFAASREPAALYQQLADSGLVMVAVSRAHAKLGVDQVTVANRAGAQSAIAHLIGLGHSRIAMITGPPEFNTARERQQGYEQALRDAGLGVDEKLIVHCDFRHASGYDAMRRLLDAPSRPTAVFPASNLLTLGALQAIHERNLDIPGEISIIGFDEMAWAMSLRPPLTTVAQPALEVGRMAAELLLDRIRKPDQPRKEVVLETRLIVRASCGAAVSSR